jgi:hypothetical protein
MIIESAFAILPESIAGMGFQRVSREANAVSAFSFSLLNALHAKNVVDPIQRLQQEKHYATKKAPLPPAGNNRHCDIYIDYGGSLIGSQRLANFGWRYQNYLEAKYLKSYKKTNSGQDTRASANTAEVIADLIRLACLVPEPDLLTGRGTPKTATARYFLVISDDPISVFINKYMKDLLAAFTDPKKSCSIDLDLTVGRPSVKLADAVGTNFNTLNVRLSHVTCFSHFPLIPTARPCCWMLLLRIDAARIEYNDTSGKKTFEFQLDRTLKEGAAGDYKAIRDFVATNLK